MYGPLELTHTSRSYYQHDGLIVVNDIYRQSVPVLVTQQLGLTQKHVSRVLRVPGLARHCYIEFRPLEQASDLPYEDVREALTLRIRENTIKLSIDLLTSC